MSTIEILIVVFVALVTGYLMGRISAKPVVVDPTKRVRPEPEVVIEEPPEKFYHLDEWDETMNRDGRS